LQLFILSQKLSETDPPISKPPEILVTGLRRLKTDN
jgi:hypothetical protein